MAKISSKNKKPKTTLPENQKQKKDKEWPKSETLTPSNLSKDVHQEEIYLIADGNAKWY